MKRIVIVGGGWAGVAASVQARKRGHEVTLLERTDLLLGLGLVAGIFRNNGRFTAAEEMIAMGGGELFRLMDSHARHRHIAFPGHAHASLYDVRTIEPAVESLLLEIGVNVVKRARIVDTDYSSGVLYRVMDEQDTWYEGDAFVDTTGSAGPMGNCYRNGHGCAMCMLRCPAFGGRVSLTRLCGIDELLCQQPDGSFGAMSGSCKLDKETLSPDIRNQLEEKGVYLAALPPAHVRREKLAAKVCQQYALPEFAENLILLDTGHAKLMTSYMPLQELRSYSGFEQARYVDPLRGGEANSVRYNAIAPAQPTLRVQGMENLFAAGEKCAPLIGLTEAVCSGVLAGENAARAVAGQEVLSLPRETLLGDLLEFIVERLDGSWIHRDRYTFSGALYFQRMKERGSYSTNLEQIADRMERAGVTGIFAG